VGWWSLDHFDGELGQGILNLRIISVGKKRPFSKDRLILASLSLSPTDISGLFWFYDRAMDAVTTPSKAGSFLTTIYLDLFSQKKRAERGGICEQRGAM
jgi:hypothetical protein